MQAVGRTSFVLAVAAALSGFAGGAWACHCADVMALSGNPCEAKKNCDKVLTAGRKKDATLILRGTMKSVLVGAETEVGGKASLQSQRVGGKNIASQTIDGRVAGKMVEGRFEVAKVVKGQAVKGTVGIVTGFGMGDCGLLPQFVAAYYQDVVIELGVAKTEIAGRTVYTANMCSYQKYPEN
jgi:hypothetical protein